MAVHRTLSGQYVAFPTVGHPCFCRPERELGRTGAGRSRFRAAGAGDECFAPEDRGSGADFDSRRH